MRGSVTRVLRTQGCGFILAEDGCEIYFDSSGLESMEMADVRVGYWVDFKLQDGRERLRAVNIKRLRGEA